MSGEQLTLPPAATEVEYREIRGYPGYRVGSDGSVWSRLKPNGRKPCTIGSEWRLRKPTKLKGGYFVIGLHSGGEERWFLVHRLVLEAFVGPCPPGHETRHFPDNDPGNNRLENLSWASRETNEADKAIHGTVPDRRGEKSLVAKLTDDQVRQIRERYTKGETQLSLAKEFGVCRPNISMIVNRKLWSHI